MRKLLQFILLKPVTWINEHWASSPHRVKIYAALDELCSDLTTGSKKRGLSLQVSPEENFIIFSDQHKGGGDGADDFLHCELSYIMALQYYFSNGYKFISLGDSEELWENTLSQVKKKHQPSFQEEKKFADAGNFYKVFGNHDLFWDNDPLAGWHLKQLYGSEISIHEAMLLNFEGSNMCRVLLTHGHQGDAASDGNWFSKFFVARIWAPLQAYLKINPNTPAYDLQLKTAHNAIMYDWSVRQPGLLLVTGHTHQPVFASLTHLERLYLKWSQAREKGDEQLLQELERSIRKREMIEKVVSVDYSTHKPTYFNSGCCCYRDGDITGLEIGAGLIRLVKWGRKKGREILEEMIIPLQ